MRWILSIIILGFILGCKQSKYLQTENVQLAEPNVFVSSVLFESDTYIDIANVVDQTRVEYFHSGKLMQIYDRPIIISESTTFLAQTVGNDFISSDTVSIELVKLPKNEVITIDSKRSLNEKYGVQGLDILIDRKKGENDFNFGWLGYVGDTVVFDLDFDIIEVDHLIVSTLRNQGAWIFSPTEINVYNDGKLIGALTLNEAVKEAKNANVFTKIDVTNISVRNLTVEIIAPKILPSWHAGKGSPPWLFIDEILIY